MMHPYAAASLMFIVFWLSTDVVAITRKSEDLVGTLRSETSECFMSLPKNEKKACLKRAKSLRAVEIPVGNFGEFSLNVPIRMWDKILNQVLFLLSL